MVAPAPHILRYIAFTAFAIAWLLLWIASDGNSYIHSSLTTRYSIGSGSYAEKGAFTIPVTLGAFKVCDYVELLDYNLVKYDETDSSCRRIPSGCVTDTYPFGVGAQVPLPLNYRDSCATFHAFQAFLVIAGIECTGLLVILAFQLIAHKATTTPALLDRYPRLHTLVERFGGTKSYRVGIAFAAVVLVSGIVSLACMPTAVDDNWADVCTELLSYNAPGAGGGGFDLCRTPAAEYGASFDCHVTALILVAIGLVCYVVAWRQELTSEVGSGAYSERLHVDSDHYDGGI